MIGHGRVKVLPAAGWPHYGSSFGRYQSYGNRSEGVGVHRPTSVISFYPAVTFWYLQNVCLVSMRTHYISRKSYNTFNENLVWSFRRLNSYYFAALDILRTNRSAVQKNVIGTPLVRIQSRLHRDTFHFGYVADGVQEGDPDRNAYKDTREKVPYFHLSHLRAGNDANTFKLELPATRTHARRFLTFLNCNFAMSAARLTRTEHRVTFYYRRENV